MLDMDQYQMAAAEFTNNDLDEHDRVDMCVFGICSEAGEIAEAIKHYRFHGHLLDRDNLKKELGDLLWYLSQLAKANGWTLSEVARKNIMKLKKRYPDGFTSEASINREENKV